jgi:hypothetical protein
VVERTQSLGWSSRRQQWLSPAVHEPRTHSGLILTSGSGSTTVAAKIARWAAGPAANTSRTAYRAFVDAIQSPNNALSAGPPQMVGLYRKGYGRTFGIRWRRQFYFGGLRVGAQASDEPGGTEWRNERFERVSAQTGHLLPGAKRHRERRPA